MAMQLLVRAAGSASTGIRDVRSVGSKTMPIRVQVTNNSQTVTIQQSPTSTGFDSTGTTSVLLPLGTIDPGGGTIVIDEPVDYILITTAASEVGPVDAYVSTSR